MTDLDPDIAAFRAADSDEARAGVLLAAPVNTLLRWRQTFERMCDVVGFGEGRRYLAALSAAMNARRERGLIATQPLESAKVDLYGVIEGHRRRAPGEAGKADRPSLPVQRPARSEPPEGGDSVRADR